MFPCVFLNVFSCPPRQFLRQIPIIQNILNSERQGARVGWLYQPGSPAVLDDVANGWQITYNNCYSRRHVLQEFQRRHEISIVLRARKWSNRNIEGPYPVG